MTPTLARELLVHALQTALANTLIALCITAFGEHDLAHNLVYSQCIGLAIWALLDGGQRWLVRDWATHWRRAVLLVPLGVVLGYAGGTLLGDVLLGRTEPPYWVTAPQKTLAYLLMSMGVGAAGTYYFLSRRQMAAAQARARAAEHRAAEARLRLLEAQLEPHMLFNTLANLRALIATDPPRATTMLDHLIAYLRGTLGASRTGTHPLRLEFERLGDYLALMAVRMGPRLHTTLALPEALRELPVPALLLQPLVENSIRHGLEPQVAGGHIHVGARREGAWLLLVVEDNGAGPDHSSAGTGFGLDQVRERLLASYGPTATLALGRGLPVGMRAEIRIPLSTPPCAHSTPH